MTIMKLHSSKFDELYTPPDAITPLIKHLPKHYKTIWCPCDTEDSVIVKELRADGRDVIATHIDNGEDFFTTEKDCDCIVTNCPYSCYSKDTEVLTQRGWVYIQDVTEEDKVLSLDFNTNLISWDGIERVIRKPVNEDLINFKNKNMDLLVTKDHRMLAYSRYSDKLVLSGGDLLSAEEVSLSRSFYFPKKGYKWKGIKKKYITLPYLKNPPRSTPKEYPETKIELHDWLEFFGLWIADGCTRSFRGYGRGYTVSIKQSEKGWKYTKDVLDKLPFKVRIQYEEACGSVKARANFDIHNKQLWLYLSQFGKTRDKFIPKWIKDLSTDYLESFIKGYTFGDSFTISYKDKVSTVYSTFSKQLAEDLQEILLKLGYLIQISERTSKTGKYWSLVFNKESCGNRAMYTQDNARNLVHYRGFVYCLTLKHNSVFLVRRKGKAIFCGNCKNAFIKRCVELQKPWALLLPLDSLCGTKRFLLTKDCGCITIAHRVDFTGKGANWFYNVWVCNVPELNGKWIKEL